ncbi:MAG: TetR/AcrR family transcriptional regulator [Acidimicrobiales bacterium]
MDVLPAIGPRSHRAASLPADERRAAIAAATLPLLLEHGSSVTTRQIAEAAGIAEGTIFRVFPDKDSVILAAVELAFDTQGITRAIESIDRSLPLEERLVQAVALIQERTARIFQLMSVVSTMPNAGQGPPVPRKPPPDIDGFVELIEPDAALLRRDPHAVVQVLRALTFGGTHPMFITGEPLTPAEIVSLALDGVRAHPRKDS